MRLSDFDYDLAPGRIAQTPVEPRDSARLLIDQGPAPALHRRVCDLSDFVGPGDLVVVNDTKVIPCRLRLHRDTGGAAEVLLLEPVAEVADGGRVWEALVRPGKKLRVGERLFASDGAAVVEIGTRTEAGDTFQITIVAEGDVLGVLATYGEMPLPPYIAVPLTTGERYQTVYANEPASAAAPTAGLHFTPTLMNALLGVGAQIATVELVVGLDTFQPMSVPDPRDHRIHSERYRVSAEVLDQCRSARRVIAVGTTATRAIESAATLGVLEGRTRLFIYRGYDWKLVDLMMTNFHLPRTTLLLMIDSFIGERWRSLYDQALAADYRFLSFGDAMLLDRSL